MRAAKPLVLIDDPAELARRGGWTEDVYVDLLGVANGALDAKYLAAREESMLSPTLSSPSSTIAFRLSMPPSICTCESPISAG